MAKTPPKTKGVVVPPTTPPIGPLQEMKVPEKKQKNPGRK